MQRVEGTQAVVETEGAQGLVTASLPVALFARTPRGFSVRKRLMESPVPAKQGSAPVAHSSPAAAELGRIPENGNLGFPQPWSEQLSLFSPPPPQCQVSSRGGVGWEVCLRSVRSPGCKVDSPQGRPRPRAHARTHSRSRKGTRSHELHTHRLRHACATPRRGSGLAARTFGASQPAGRGAGSREIDNRFCGLQRISLLEAKPHKPNPLAAQRLRRKSNRSQSWGRAGGGRWVSETPVSPAADSG